MWVIVVTILAFSATIFEVTYAKSPMGLPEVLLVKDKIHSSLSDWEFKVVFAFEDQVKTISKIEIREASSKKLLQTLSNPGKDTVNKDQNPLKLADANSDGYLDLHILTVCGNKNCDDECWLFEPNSGKFVFSKAHSGTRPR